MASHESQHKIQPYIWKQINFLQPLRGGKKKSKALLNYLMQELGVIHFQCALTFLQGWTRAKQPAAWDLQRKYSPGVSLQFFQSGSYQVSQRLLNERILCPQFPWLVSLWNEKYVARNPIYIMQSQLGKWLKHENHSVTRYSIKQPLVLTTSAFSRIRLIIERPLFCAHVWYLC